MSVVHVLVTVTPLKGVFSPIPRCLFCVSLLFMVAHKMSLAETILETILDLLVRILTYTI